MAMATDWPDFMSFLLKYNDEKGLSVSEIRSNSNVLIPGGSDDWYFPHWHNLVPAQEPYGLQDLDRGGLGKLPERGRGLCYEAC